MDADSNTTTAQAGPAPEVDLASELAASKAKAEENYNKFLYAMADFENYKKRMERDVERVAGHGKRMLIEKLLPVVDNLERALEHDTDSEAVREGLKSTLRGFEQVLAGEGVRSFSVAGQRFDPNLADAIGTQRAPGLEEDTVVEEAQRGYKIGDDVLRPAKVIVSKSDA